MLPPDIAEVNVASKLFDFDFRYPARLAHMEGFVQDVYKAVRGYDCRIKLNTYRQVSNINRTLIGNKIVNHSDVVGASPVGAAPTTSSFST